MNEPIERRTTTREELESFSGGNPAARRRLRFYLAGVDLDPDVVTSLTGIAPDETWKHGDIHPRTGRVIDVGMWIVASGSPPSSEIHSQFDALLQRLRPAWPILRSLAGRYATSFEAAIHFDDAQGPLLVLLPDVISSVNELGAEISFDLYCLEEGRPADPPVSSTTRIARESPVGGTST